MMYVTMDRDSVSKLAEEYKEVLDTETHHNHELIEDDNRVIRWKENTEVGDLCDKAINLNDLYALLQLLGYDKNSEVLRNLYRNLGYSLYGYWEVFYWEVNNEKASEYRPVPMKKTTLNYVCCDRCYEKGQVPKLDIEKALALNPQKYFRNTHRYIIAICDLWNGFVYRFPLCCTLQFCYMVAKGLRPAIVLGILRGDPRWNRQKLSNKEVEYLNSKYYGG